MATFPRCAVQSASLLLGVALLAGCSGRPTTVAVSGKVTFDGGPVPGEGIVYFTSENSARPAMAEFDQQGNYVATTWQEGDGILPGKYRVHLECWAQPPNMEGRPVKSHLPKKYMSSQSSELELVVDGSERHQEYHIDVVSATK